ncbi:MMPL family transporter [Candidatus Lucifugimonas marina]|uniref:MMPL family transporter n=1 Tax=Candidatus Lucifugimonas marina TaxID=3038979 RepID=A0AAJ6CSQ3_9CHLR|nr:MMPL family transporter [SAR202 cluster bacterium JH702]MDG0869951.1 MMPL family transporter [SAR202 cluster bacterium JH639]WFG34674.1 MMPL family transporter [SAR202 cluster bacterium JH545]WFG38602.1 MMPL family transporter [SAR202 cluster bacterium JH1073]
MSALSTSNLAKSAARKPRTTILIWVIAFFIAGGLAGTFLQGNLSSQWRFLNNPESQVADDLIAEHLRDPYAAVETVIVTSDSFKYDQIEFVSFADQIATDILELGPEIVTSTRERIVNEDRDAALIFVRMAGSADEATLEVEKIHEIIDHANENDQFSVVVTGNATLSLDFVEGSEKDLLTGEAIGIPFAVIILILVFGAIMAAAIPLIIAILAIVIALGVAAVIGEGFQLSIFVVNVATMMGLAVGIDYSLFIIERYREERRKGSSIDDSIEIASNTASRAVLFSGITVVLAVAGLFFVPTDLFWSLAIGSILVVMTSVIAALTLLPAIIKLLGDRINKWSIKAVVKRQDAELKSGFWDKIASVVMGQPIISLFLSVGILVAMAIPYFDISTGLAGVSTMPEHFRSRTGFETLDSKFSGGLMAPIILVVERPDRTLDLQDRLEAFTDAIGGFPVVETSPDKQIMTISLAPPGDAATADAMKAIQTLREQTIPGAFGPYADDVHVTGWAARQADFTEVADNRQIPVIVFVLGLSFILLTLVFRSILVPLKAVIMNLLSVGAAYGLIVLVFQKGVGNEIFGFQQVESIESWLPIFLFAILFGLSMDYHVFLLSRIKEHFSETDDNRASVAHGLRSTGRIITGAALIMVVVFGGFAAGDLTLLQQMGFGLAVAVFLDATLVRSVLVPATMRLLGRRNWYLPSWLEWLPHLDIEGLRKR